MRHTALLICLLTAAAFAAPQEAEPAPAVAPPTNTEPAEDAAASAPAEGPVLVVPLSDDGKYMVDQVQADFIIQQLNAARDQGYSRIVLKIDTYGGVVFSAREITEALLRSDIPTVAYVETKAISAGAFIAWACDEIVMEAHTTLGDAQMIIQTVDGIKPAPEKAVTVFRSDWKKSSHLKGRSFALAQGFFDPAVEVLQVGTPEAFSFVLRDDYDQQPQSERLPIMAVISKKDQLLTLFAEEARDLGLVAVYPDWDTFLADRGMRDTRLTAVEMTTNQKILRFLSVHTWIFFVLTLIGLNGIYIEIKAPGFGLPGFTALVCFTIVFGTHYLLGTASGLEMACFVLGLALCAAEIFLIPGVGVVGISGLVLMFGALVMAAFPSFDGLPSHDLQYRWLSSIALQLLGAFFGSVVLMVFLVDRLFALPVAKRATLQQTFGADQGYVMDTGGAFKHLVGSTGTAMGDLRPVGRMVLDDGNLLDVTAESHFVPDQTALTITAVEGNRILVRPNPATETFDAATGDDAPAAPQA